MPKPDKLDYAVSIALCIVLLIVIPILVGQATTPYIDGKPMLLNATVLQEQQYIAEARKAIALCADAHKYLATLPPAEQAIAASATLQNHVDTTDRAWTEWEAHTPPGRFSTLHGQVLSLIKLYRYLVGEAWSYYGDLDATHLAEVRRGLEEGGSEQERLSRLFDALDFQAAPKQTSPLTQDRSQPQSELEEWQ